MSHAHDELIHRIVFGVTQAIADLAERMAREPSARLVPGDVSLMLLAETIRDTNSKFAEALADQSTRH